MGHEFQVKAKENQTRNKERQGVGKSPGVCRWCQAALLGVCGRCRKHSGRYGWKGSVGARISRASCKNFTWSAGALDVSEKMSNIFKAVLREDFILTVVCGIY